MTDLNVDTNKVFRLVEAGTSIGATGMFQSEPDVVSVPKAAEMLDVNPMTIRREIQRGNLGCFHVGKSVRITKAQLIDYVQGRMG